MEMRAVMYVIQANSNLSRPRIPSNSPVLTTLQIKRGTRTNLPLWLGELLAVQRLGNSAIVNLDLPDTLSPRVLNALKADPKTVDLRALAQHFYGLAARVLDLFEEEEIVDILTEVGEIYWEAFGTGRGEGSG